MDTQFSPFQQNTNKAQDFTNVRELWTRLKSNGERYKPVWDEIGKYVNIQVDPNLIYYNNQTRASQKLDEFIDDPTASLAVSQAADYLVGIMWGTGQDILDVVPSRYVLEYATLDEVKDWYDFVTDQTLYHFNHPQSGWLSSLQPYALDQFSFGTSGIGVFPNPAFAQRVDDNAFVCRPYGIDSTRIDEGKSGIPEIVFTVYRWRTSRIVSELCSLQGVLSQELIAKLPKKIQDAYNVGDVNQEFSLVCGIFPREDFDPKYVGKRGTRYRGCWFLDDAPNNEIFYEEDFAERPIAMCRQTKIRGEVYGRSTGTLLMSSIRSNNYIVGNVIEVLEKMGNPALGLWNNAIFGDSVLDSSGGGMTIFNAALAVGNQPPVFPIHDVGDPAEIIKFLIPYLNEKITTGFKLDMLLDFNNTTDMTATESLQRYAIRGKAMSAMLSQQKIEVLDPSVRRGISVLHNFGELGIDATKNPLHATALMQQGKHARVIPESVVKTMAAGRPWYELKWNNELDKLQRTQAVQNLVQILQTVTAMAAVYPMIVHAVDWYQLLQDINENLDYNNQVLIGEKEFKAALVEAAKQAQQAQQIQMGAAQAAAAVDGANARKTNAEAQNGGQ